MNTFKQGITISLIVFLLSVTQYAGAFYDPDYWVEIGNPGNVADNTGYGSVDYEYSIGKYEVTNSEYIAFLNAVGADPNGSDELFVPEPTYASYYGITYNDNTNQFVLKNHALDSSDTGYVFYENKPVTYVSWYDALRFVNWLNSGNTEYGAYDLSLQSTDPQSIMRLTEATYWLPSEDEWYKAAYYDPEEVRYWNYPTGTDTAPDAEAPVGDDNSANFDYALLTDPELTDVGAYADSESPYDTYDQAGNLYEWLEALINDEYRGLRGGAWKTDLASLASNDRAGTDPLNEGRVYGFRIAYSGEVVPEPMTIGLLIAGLFGLVYRRNKQ